MSPEVISKGSSFSSDIWALGCTIIELITGFPPFADLLPHAAIFTISSGVAPQIPQGITPVIFILILKCGFID